MPMKFGGGPKCVICTKSAYANESLSFEGAVYHHDCFNCSICKKKIQSVSSAGAMKGEVSHKKCFSEQFRSTGGKYGGAKVVKGEAGIVTSATSSNTPAVKAPATAAKVDDGKAKAEKEAKAKAEAEAAAKKAAEAKAKAEAEKAATAAAAAAAAAEAEKAAAAKAEAEKAAAAEADKAAAAKAEAEKAAAATVEAPAQEAKKEEEKTAPAPKKVTPAKKPPSLTESDKKDKVFIERYDGKADKTLQEKPIEYECTLEDGKPICGVYIGSCNDCTVMVKGKSKNVTISGCQNVNVLVDNCVTTIEVVNCKKTAVQASEQCGTFTIDKSDRTKLYIPDASCKGDASALVFCSATTCTNVYFSTADGEDQVEYAVPEQILTTIQIGKDAHTKVVSNEE